MKESKAMEIVECAGTSYEIGRQYGEACRASLQKSLDLCLEKLVGAVQATMQVTISREEVWATAGKFLPLTERFDPDLIEFVKGEAAGAGMSFGEAFYLRCSYEMLWHYGQISGLCTSFAVTGEASENGKTILGRNIDFTCDDWPFNLLKIRHADGLEQLALCIAGVECEVLNSYGYANSMNGTFNQDYRLNLPCGCYLPKVMRQRSLSSALRLLGQAARGSFYHVLASAEGDLVGFESVSDHFRIIQPEKDMLVHSNHYLTERFQEVDGIYTTFQDFVDTFPRITRIKRLMEQQYGTITLQMMMGILSDHQGYPYSICKHPATDPHLWANGETLASIILVPGDRKMYIALGNPCQCEYVEYGL
jgi:isopenicillin-N N-acyltransferase-like protein